MDKAVESEGIPLPPYGNGTGKKDAAFKRRIREECKDMRASLGRMSTALAELKVLLKEAWEEEMDSSIIPPKRPPVARRAS